MNLHSATHLRPLTNIRPSVCGSVKLKGEPIRATVATRQHATDVTVHTDLFSKSSRFLVLIHSIEKLAP